MAQCSQPGQGQLATVSGLAAHPGRKAAALLVRQRALYVTAHGGSCSSEHAHAPGSLDHKATVSGRSKGEVYQSQGGSSSEKSSGARSQPRARRAQQKGLSELVQKMPEGTQKMPVGTFSKSGTGSCTSISAPRWADLDNEEGVSKAEILKLLAVLGLPHLCDSEGHKQCVFEAWPECHEATDF